MSLLFDGKFSSQVKYSWNIFPTSFFKWKKIKKIKINFQFKFDGKITFRQKLTDSKSKFLFIFFFYLFLFICTGSKLNWIFSNLFYRRSILDEKYLRFSFINILEKASEVLRACVLTSSRQNVKWFARRHYWDLNNISLHIVDYYLLSLRAYIRMSNEWADSLDCCMWLFACIFRSHTNGILFDGYNFFFFFIHFYI